MPSFSDLKSSTLEVIPGLLQISARYTNLFLIFEKDLTLIDTGFGSSVPLIQRAIRDHGRSIAELKLVLFTHNHSDHTGGLAKLLRLARFQTAMHSHDIVVDPRDLYPENWLLGRMLMHGPIKNRFMLDKSRIDIVLAGGESFDILGGMQVINTPGHTPGSISFYFPVHKLLIAGDAVGSRRGQLQLPRKSVSRNMAQAADSIRVVSQLDIAILCKGHGRPIMQNAAAELYKLVSGFN